MNDLLHRLRRRALTAALGLILAVGAMGAAPPAIHAEPTAPADHMTVPCRDGGRWYADGAVVSIHDEEDGVTDYYQCRDGQWEEIMGTRHVRGGTTWPGTVRPVGMLSPR
jgi:hypothetical protein